mgnify:CR=1 FL=1
MSLNIQCAVCEVDQLYDWTGIREGGFHFSATDVTAQGWDGNLGHYYIGRGKTAHEAYTKLRAEIPTCAGRAKKLRADAAKLIAEADAITADAPTIEFP